MSLSRTTAGRAGWLTTRASSVGQECNIGEDFCQHPRRLFAAAFARGIEPTYAGSANPVCFKGSAPAAPPCCPAVHLHLSRVRLLKKPSDLPGSIRPASRTCGNWDAGGTAGTRAHVDSDPVECEADRCPGWWRVAFRADRWRWSAAKPV